MQRYALGLDLGQVSDSSALALAVERPQTPQERADQLAEHAASQRGKERPAPAPPPEAHHDMPGLKRWALGTSYPAIVDDVADYAARVRAGAHHALLALVVDATGVGRPVVDLFAIDKRLKALRVILVAVTITGGTAVTIGRRDDGAHDWHVPKKELVGASQMLLQTRRLHIASSLAEAATLTNELRNFKMKITTSANMQLEAWREGQHDDLVLAGALASWSLLRGPLGQAVSAAAGGKRAEVPLRAGGGTDLPPLFGRGGG